MRVIMRLVLFIVLFYLAKRVSSKKCPSVYLRFSKTHTFCLEPNTKCDVKFSGVSEKEKVIILDAHNRYRNEVATGKETRAKGGALPEASDMLQMEWDEELAAIAQKWAENCIYEHDCKDGCRMVENFSVGQNLARHSYSCPSKGCTKEQEKNFTEATWEYPLQRFYDEVKLYNKKWFDSHTEQSKDIGHFTQMVWSKSWRIGCGYTAFKERDTYHKFYACNYGPSGNVRDQPLYKKGTPCSECPVNTCCGKACGKKADYPGLCKMLDPDTAPIYTRETDSLLFFCDMSPANEDCAMKLSGSKRWKNIASLNGNLYSIQLKGGKETTMSFEKEITPTENFFCVRVLYRKGPKKAEEKDESGATLNIVTPNQNIYKSLKTSPILYLSYQVSIGWKYPYKIELHFSVPSGGKRHIFDVKEIIAYNGRCSKEEF